MGEEREARESALPVPDFHVQGSRRQQNARRLLSGRLLRESRERFRDYSQDPPVEGFTTFWRSLELGDS